MRISDWSSDVCSSDLDVARRRERWKTLQPHLDPDRLVFIDETWIKTNMTPIRGWGPKGKRLRAFAPHGHWRTLTFLGALRKDRLAAPCVFDGPINGQCFREIGRATSELQSLMRISYSVFCLKKTKKKKHI